MKYNKFFVVVLFLCNLPAIYSHTKETDLLEAAETGNTENLYSLAADKVNVNAYDKDGFTPLMLASIYGHAGAVQLLVDSNA